MLTPEDKQILLDLKAIGDSLKCPMLLVGALARLIIFDLPFNIQGRATKDVDVAISIESWSDFERLSDRMTQGDSPRFRKTKTEHNFIHIETEKSIDIVPFGKIGEPNWQIEWSDDKRMNVMGFSEALNHANSTIDDLDFLIINLPAFIVLKLFAWSDRQFKKDLEDIDLILKNYTDDERIYAELYTQLSSGDIEYQNAGIYLLGSDICKMFGIEALQQVNLVLDRLILSLDGYDDSDPIQKVKFLQCQRFKFLQQGIYRVATGSE